MNLPQNLRSYQTTVLVAEFHKYNKENIDKSTFLKPLILNLNNTLFSHSNFTF